MICTDAAGTVDRAGMMIIPEPPRSVKERKCDGEGCSVLRVESRDGLGVIRRRSYHRCRAGTGWGTAGRRPRVQSRPARFTPRFFFALYISIYGFTPLRLQSSWLVCVLFAGCVLWILNLFTGKRVFRLWMYFSGITLTLLMLY